MIHGLHARIRKIRPIILCQNFRVQRYVFFIALYPLENRLGSTSSGNDTMHPANITTVKNNAKNAVIFFIVPPPYELTSSRYIPE